MADVGSHHFVKGAHKNVLVPQPSDNPNDPLNWSSTWKVACITAAAMVTFTQGFGPLALAPMFPALMKSFDCDLEEAVQFTGVCILVLGFSNFIWYVGSASPMKLDQKPELTVHQGPTFDLIWPPPSLHRLPAHKLRYLYLARQSHLL